MQTEQYVPLADLAAEWGMDRSNARKYVLASGLTPVKIRTARSSGQLTLALSLIEAQALREMRRAGGFGANPVPILVPEIGSFYVVQLVPELAPNRIKLGFAANPRTRLQEHRTAAPTATLRQTWPCQRCWEVAAIASITRCDCRMIGPEVFDCVDIDALLARGTAFFDLMPQPDKVHDGAERRGAEP